MFGLNAAGAWIGGRRELGNWNNWVWLDGTPWDYDNWAPGAPNGGNENCIRMYESDPDGRWNDIECGEERTFVCKKGKKQYYVELTRKPLII